MAFDYKKEYKEFYMPKGTPSIVTVPKMNYIAVRGGGNPNDEDGEYKQAIGLLYGIAFTIKMSKKGNRQIDGYFDYVVPPLEGFWWQDGVTGVDYAHKDAFQWISVIRLPDFVSKEDFDWAVREATAKKKQDFSKVEFFTYDEGLCVQCMHVGPYDDEPATVEAMHRSMEGQGYVLDITDQRMHHEIYLSDARKVAPEKLKTVIRHPIKVKETMIKVYCYSKCSTCKKAIKWLEENEFPHEIVDIKTEHPDESTLRMYYEKSGLPLRRFFNTSGMQYREMGLSKKLPDMTEDEQLALLASDGMLVKRPLVAGDGLILTGFREAEWEEKLNGHART